MKKNSPTISLFRLKNWWWVLLFFIAAGLRFWQLNNIPAVLNRDEAAIAYNAYLLNETGMDEWQQRWPLTFLSFGDYKLPGYVWAVIGSFKLLGYTDFAVRFPSALAGSLLPIAMFWFARRSIGWSQKSSVLVSVLTATLPVLVFYSRIAFEANVALLWLIVSFCLLFDKHVIPSFPKIIGGLGFLGLAILTYNTPLLLLPAIFLYAVVYYRCPEITSSIRITALVVMLIIGISLGVLLSNIASQKQTVTIFGDETMILKANENYARWAGPWQKIAGSKILFFGQAVAQRYIATFSPTFLVTMGGKHPWHQMPHASHFTWSIYVLSMIGLFAGIIRCIRLILRGKWLSSADNVSWLLLLTLTAPLPASITIDAPHATRSLLLFVMLACWAVYGLRAMRFVIRKYYHKLVKVASIVICLVVVAELGWYFDRYFTSYNVESQINLKDGYDWQVQKLAATNPMAPVAVIDREGYLYIMTAWFLRMPPEAFFSTVQHHLPDKIGFRYGYKVGQFRFVVKPDDQDPSERSRVEWNEKEKQWQTITL